MEGEPWILDENPSAFYHYNWYADEISARKFYLFLIEIGRRVRHLMTDPDAIAMLGFCEQCADGKITEDELANLADEHRSDGPSEADCLFWWIADRYKVHSRGVAVLLDVFEDREKTASEWGALVRDIYGPNPFQPVAFAPGWRTDTATAIARQMYESRDFGAMPILADALQDAGCDNEHILHHCRNEGVHVRGCWVVDLVLGKA